MYLQKGSVSLFTAMIFLLVAAVITTTIYSARVQGARVMTSTALSMALDSVFASYDQTLFTQFGVLFFDGAMGQDFVDTEQIANRIADYMAPNLSHSSFSADLYQIDVISVAVNTAATATDQGGVLWEEAVINYEKYAKVIDLAADFLNIKEGNNVTSKITELSTDFYSYGSALLSIQNQAKILVETIDGVKCPSDGIDPDHISVVSSFLKKFLPERSEKMLSIPYQNISSKVFAKTVDPIDLLTGSKDSFCSGDLDTSTLNLKLFSDLVSSCLSLSANALSAVSKTSTGIAELCASVETLLSHADEYIDLFGEDNASLILNAFRETGNYDAVMADQICDLETAASSLQKNNELFLQIEEILSSIDLSASVDSQETVQKLDTLIDLSGQIDYSDITFQYDRLFSEDSDTQSSWDIFREILDYGILSITMPDDETVSERKITVADLASSVCDIKKTPQVLSDVDFLTRTEKEIIYGEYVMDHFSSFTDHEEGAALNYEVEYILYGQDNDKQNLMYAVSEIADIRTLVNLAYLLTDQDRMDECEEVANMWAGWTGNDVLPIIIKYMLALFWANTESYSDVKILLSGKKVNLIKDSDAWQTTLTNVFTCKVSPDLTKCDKGLDYEAFLRFLLFTERDGKRSGRTMDLVELWMIASGRSDFRMKNYIYSLDASILYTVSDNPVKYDQTQACSY